MSHKFVLTKDMQVRGELGVLEYFSMVYCALHLTSKHFGAWFDILSSNFVYVEGLIVFNAVLSSSIDFSMQE